MDLDEREQEQAHDREWALRSGFCPDCGEWDGQHAVECEHFESDEREDQGQA